MSNNFRDLPSFPPRRACSLRDASLEPDAMDVRKLLMIAGAVLIAAGLAWPWLRALPFGRLPGDIAVSRPGVHIYFPIVTCIIISVVLSLLFWIFRK
jgi:hypothetical protein